MTNVHTRELLKKYQKDISRKNKGILSLTQYFPVCIIIKKGFPLKLSIFDPPLFFHFNSQTEPYFFAAVIAYPDMPEIVVGNLYFSEVMW